MTWIIKYVDNFIDDIDKVYGISIQDAKRNLIAKIGSNEIKFLEVKPC